MNAQVPLFATLTPAQRSQLCTALKPMHVRSGTAIVRAGDVGETFYVVEAGICSVVNADNKVWKACRVKYCLNDL